MTPIRLSTSWYRRYYIAVALLSLAFVVIFGLEFSGVVAIPAELQVSLISAAIAGATLVAATLFAIITKKVSSFFPSFSVFVLFGLATTYLIITTGGVTSQYLGVWMLVALISPLFGAAGWVPVIAVTGVHIAWSYLESNGITVQTAVLTSLSSALPLIAGFILWRNQPEYEEKVEKNVKNLANELSEVATRSEIVINAIGDGVIAIDGKGVIQLINPAAQEILGWGKQDALMLNYKSILKLTDEQGKELTPATNPVDQVLNTNQRTRSNKLIALSQSGKKLSISLTASPIGEMGSGAIMVFRDVTKERAEEREQAEFISTASHEMRTPVASIEGYLGLAMNPQTATIDARAQGFIQKAHEAAQHLGRLFQDLLDVSKSEDGRMSNLPRVVDIANLTGTIVQGLMQKATDKGLNLSYVPGGIDSDKKIMPMYYVNLDNDHIREVLDNLIENAIKYTPKGGVQVDVTGTEEKVLISIKDTGLGIPAEDIPHLFQKFYRVDNMDRQEIGGTGLGLYLSRRLIEAMQGRLWVESVFGQGSTFFVELPRIDSQQAEQLKAIQAQEITQTAQQAATQPASFQPDMTPSSAPAPTAAPSTPAPAAKPATTVPRGESLSRDQIAERVRQLEEMAKQQRAQQGQRQ